MHFLFLNQFYPPDRAPTGQYLHDLARILVAGGHQVTVITSSGGYEAGGTIATSGVHDGVRVLRVPALSFGRGRAVGRLADYLSYVVLALRRAALLKPAPDLVLSLTTPPFLGVIGRWIAQRHRCPHAHWVMDVYPDALAVAGALSRRAWGYRALAWLATRHWSEARLVLALGPCMAQRLAVYCSGRVPPWVPLWVLPTACGSGSASGGSASGGSSSRQAGGAQVARVQALREARGWTDVCVVAYTGNLGRGHDLSGLFAALGHQSEALIRVLVLALPATPAGQAAAVRARLAAPGLRVECIPHASDQGLADHLAAADVHLVAVRRGWEGVVVPSKLQGIMAAGRPALVLAAPTAEAALWVTAADAGWCAAPDDVEAIGIALHACLEVGERERRGGAARAWALRMFDRDTGTHRVARLCEWAAGKRR